MGDSEAPLVDAFDIDIDIDAIGGPGDPLFTTSTDDQIARAVSEIDEASVQPLPRNKREEPHKGHRAKERHDPNANDEALARAHQLKVDATIANSLWQAQKRKLRAEQAKGAFEWQAELEGDELMDIVNEGFYVGRDAQEPSIGSRPAKRKGVPRDKYTSLMQREEREAAMAEMSARQRRKRSKYAAANVDIYAKRAIVHAQVKAAEQRVNRVWADHKVQEDEPEIRPTDLKGVQDTINDRLSPTHLQSPSTGHRRILRTATIKSSPRASRLSATRTAPAIEVTPPPLPDLAWDHIRREGLPQRSLSRLDTDCLLSESFILEANEVLDALYGLPEDQASGIIDTFKDLHESTFPDRKVEFTKSGFRSWVIEIKLPQSRSQTKKPYEEYVKGRSAYDMRPFDFERLGYETMRPESKNKKDGMRTLQRGLNSVRDVGNSGWSTDTRKDNGARRLMPPPTLPVSRDSRLMPLRRAPSPPKSKLRSPTPLPRTPRSIPPQQAPTALNSTSLESPPTSRPAKRDLANNTNKIATPQNTTTTEIENHKRAQASHVKLNYYTRRLPPSPAPVQQPPPRRPKKPKVHKRVEAWRHNPDAN